MGTADRAGGTAAAVFPPGEFIRDELAARGWTQRQLAEILGRPEQVVSAILNAKKEITPETAMALAEAFGTSAELWLNLEGSYRLSRAGAPGGDVRRRARLHSLVPLRELIARRWIDDVSDDLDALEAAVCEFLEMRSIDEQPRVMMAARRSGDRHDLTPGQVAWAFRAKHVASTVPAPPYSRREAERIVPLLPRLSADDRRMRTVVPSLTQVGVRVVRVPHLPGTRIDGATFWLDPHSPVVALSLRYDRVDSFWFTLMHELAHVRQGYAEVGLFDSDLVAEAAQRRKRGPACEREADRLASRWLIPTDELRKFIRRTRPFYSAASIRAFADSVGVHPGIVLGRLQHQGEVPYGNLRRMLEKVSPLLGTDPQR